jgi:AraC family transcriptional regulator
MSVEGPTILRRRYGDAVAHSLGLTDVPAIRMRALRHSDVGISRLSIGKAQLGLTARIPAEDTFIVAMYLTAVAHHELWSRDRCVIRQGYRASSIRIVNLREEYSARITSPHETLVFYVPRLALDEFSDDAGVRRVADFSCQPGIIDPVMAHLGASLLPAFEQVNTASNLFINHVTLAMLTHLCTAYSGRLKEPPYRKGAMTRPQANLAKEYLASHCADNILLGDVARACGLSRGHFTKSFRVATGLTPYQWLQRYRVDKAKHLLLNSKASIADIAATCGFADQSHLTRVFSRFVGDSPAAWRRRR